MALNRWLSLFPEDTHSRATEAYKRLRAHYAEPHRAYHTFDHILSCLELLDTIKPELQNPRTMELALWYHDVIYDPRADDNEEQSAQMATKELTELGETAECQQEVARMIRVTEHPSEPQTRDDCFLLDIDLSILGANRQGFEDYERQVRFEYQWVPEGVYRRKRTEVLESFLGQTAIYRTPGFFEAREKQARNNLEWSVRSLKAGTLP
ncbi:putative metal-dependent HD superfamily phosphohydrolase [Halospina denitrificans]|uniref:Putative metal-dependent HD superfamily phosphohydrolase n=1 Tax=Halospina denitrificans TaxID=332522 RepID=A0A4R7JZG7_9GAMM|nr:HD domain-containing protein [Halospina denitrificans]TDT43940.1 putative metal-dependent HD superfamily phosphohydrolase [Halospina denitrificans]